ncbi:MAG: monooxygenase [Nitrospirales bacterium]|nr:monooxygenase [Nitrospirales bacterium]
MEKQTDVVIVGAGGGGAILGLALAQKNIDTLVLEQALGPPTGIRGEILQPNGQKILDELGILEQLPCDAVRPVQFFHFRQIGGGRLCTIDYDLLPPPYNRALVTRPHLAHQIVLQALEQRRPNSLWYGASFRKLLRKDQQVVGVEAEVEGRSVKIAAKLVIGADGPFSKVREALAIPTQLHRYPESYVVSILDCPDDLEETQYCIGRQTILGLFPVAQKKVYVVYMVPSNSMAAVKTAGLSALREKWTTIYPELHRTFETLIDWNQTAYMPTGRARAATWVRDGALILGDAAHGMNPHASQGRMQAMVDAMVLAEHIPTWLEQGDYSAATLRVFEACRRPHVEMLQRLADEEAFFWNTGNPIVAYLRNRVFSTLDRNRRLRYNVLAATAGLRDSPPFGWLDRLQAVGFLPDPYANDLPAGAVPVVS